VQAIARDIGRLAPGAVVINMVEPIDLLTLSIQETLECDRFKVMGVGGLLSSTRLRHLVARALGVSPREVTALIIGPHHRSMTFLRDTIRVSGIPATALLGEERLTQLIEEALSAATPSWRCPSAPPRTTPPARRRRRSSMPSSPIRRPCCGLRALRG